MVAVFKHEGDAIDWVNDGATELSAGWLINLGDGMYGVTKQPIAPSGLGGLAIEGIVEVPKRTASDVFAIGDFVMLSESQQDATLSSGSLHRASADSANGDLTVCVKLNIGGGGGGAGGDQNLFETFAVSGQLDVVADSPTDTLTLVAGTNITLTTDQATDEITINGTSPAGAQNLFETVRVSGQNDIVADNTTDILTLVAGTDIEITTDDTTDSLTINSTGLAFVNIEVSGQNTVVADSNADTLTLVAGTNISIITDDTTDSITINATGGGGGDQNLWESIAVSGSTTLVASETQDTLNLVAGTNITITTTAPDIVTINSTGGGGVITFSTALPTGGADGDTWFIEEESLYEGMTFQRQTGTWVYQGQWYVPRKTTSAATGSGGVITTQGDIDLIGAQLPAGKEFWWQAPTDVGAIEAADYQITEDGSGGGIQGKFPRGTSGGGAGAIQDLDWDNVNDWYNISDGGTTTFVDKVGWSLIDSIWVNGLDRKETRINQTLPALATAGDWDASLGFIGQWAGAVPAVLDDVANLPLGEWMTIDFRKTDIDAGITLSTAANFDAASVTAAQFLSDSSIGHYEVTIRRTALGTGSGELQLRALNTGVRTGIGPALPAASAYDMWLLLLHPTLPDGLWLSNGTTWAAL